MKRRHRALFSIFATLSLVQLAHCGGRVDDVRSSNDPAGSSNQPPSSTPPSTTPTACADTRVAVEGEPDVVDIALDAQFVYLLEVTYPSSGPGATAIRRVDRCTGAITTFANGPQNPAQIAIDDQSVYWVTTNEPSGGNGGSTLQRISKTGSGQATLRTATDAAGEISAVTIANGTLVWIEAGALRSEATTLAVVPNARGKIVSSGNYIFVPEYDDVQFTFDVRRVDVGNPKTSVVYPNANASAAMAYFQGNLYVDGSQNVKLATPKGASDSPFGQAFAVTTNATDVFVADLNDGAGNALFRVDATGARTLLDQGGALGPSVMTADANVVAWTDGDFFHLTPL